MNSILLFLFYIALLSFAIAGISAAPWVPTKKTDQDLIIKLANIKKGQTFIELGSGTGDLLLKAAENGAIAIGYEISIIPYLISQIKRILHPNKKNITIHFKSFWSADISQADVIYFFLMPKIYKKIENKFSKCKKNCLIISYVWPLKIKSNQKTKTIQGKNKIHLHFI